MKLDYNYVKMKIEEKNGYKLLSKEYINARTPLSIQCNMGHIYKSTFDRFSSNHFCPFCNGNAKITLNKLKNLIKNRGYFPYDISEFKNSKSNIKLKCKNGHIFKTTWNYLNSGMNCPRCNGGSRIPYNEIKKTYEKEGYKLLSKEYKNANTRLEIECDKGHRYYGIYSNFYQGHRCPHCSNSKMYSKGEKEVLDYIKSIYTGPILPNDRTTILNPKTGYYLELDIYLPELNLAIEYNGIYFHSDGETLYKDDIKLNECSNKGIILFIIMDTEWNNNKSEICNKIKRLIT